MAVLVLLFIVKKLNSLIQKEVGFLWGVEKEMKSLSITLSKIQVMLEDVEKMRFQDERIQDWLRQLKYAAYEVDDVLDECVTAAHRRESTRKAGTLFLLYPWSSSHKFGYRLKAIKKNLDALAELLMTFYSRGSMAELEVSFAGLRETSSSLTQPQLYGREEDRKKIIQMLVGNVYEGERVSFYAITGMAGLGKTAVAQMVFQNETIEKYFQIRIWVSVPKDFNVKRVIKETIQSITGTTYEAKDLHSMQKKLQSVLDYKKFLLVLDDVWDEDQEKWKMLKSVLDCGSYGSSAIVTTRSAKIASIITHHPPYHLSVLSDDDCWKLFRETAFGHDSEENPELVEIGKEIVKKCGGVPSAAKAIGELLRFKRKPNEWLYIQKSEIWNLPEQDKNSILAALRLSYYNLPLEWRPCFAYCATFPKGSRIYEENLIQLWMANGFITGNGTLEPEDIGEQICRELHWRSLFQDMVKDEDGFSTYFQMHDLVHDLALSVMQDEYQMMEVKSSSNISIRKVRHVTLVVDDHGFDMLRTLQKAASLRTIRLQHQQSTPSHTATSEFLSNFRKLGYLRVFDAKGTRMTKIPSSIGNSKHLSYLDLSGTNIRHLPQSICSLWNLQTLLLNFCYYLTGLPRNMKSLISLRHLYLSSCPLIDEMPPQIGQLTGLKTLSLFVVGESRGCGLDQLHCLNLGGDLRIEHLERMKSPTEAVEANLGVKKNLRRLELCWEDNTEPKSPGNAEELLDALKPHPLLKALFICQYRGIHFPNWMRDSTLQNTIEIELDNCQNCSLLPPFGQLPLLRRLQIRGMDQVEYIDDFPGEGPVRGYPSLEELTIEELPNLKGLSREEGRELLPRLLTMNIRGCPHLSFPSLPSLKTLTVGSKCTNVVLHSISNLSGLTELYVKDNEEAISFPEEVLGNLSVLESLTISWFRKLYVFPNDLASHVASELLDVSGHPELEALPDQGRRCLEYLQHLEISYCDMFSSFSEGLQHLTALQKLEISGCPHLVALPEVLRHVPALQFLDVQFCSPDLARRCAIGTGEDWPKIAHVPHISVRDYRESEESQD